MLWLRSDEASALSSLYWPSSMPGTLWTKPGIAGVVGRADLGKTWGQRLRSKNLAKPYRSTHFHVRSKRQ